VLWPGFRGRATRRCRPGRSLTGAGAWRRLSVLDLEKCLVNRHFTE
jgi:hypothetical protein